MSSLAVLTPSYAPDFDLCRELNRSVLDRTPSDVDHHLIVPRRDRELFAPVRSHCRAQPFRVLSALCSRTT